MRRYQTYYYFVISLNFANSEAIIQKLGENHLRTKRYTVKFQDMYLASPHPTYNNINNDSDNDGCDDIDLFRGIPIIHNANHDANVSFDPAVRRSQRVTRPPEWLSTDEIERT